MDRLDGLDLDRSYCEKKRKQREAVLEEIWKGFGEDSIKTEGWKVKKKDGVRCLWKIINWGRFKIKKNLIDVKGIGREGIIKENGLRKEPYWWNIK